MNVGRGPFKVGKKRSRHGLVVMLAGMHEDRPDRDRRLAREQKRCALPVVFTNRGNQWRGLHEVRPGSYNDHELHICASWGFDLGPCRSPGIFTVDTLDMVLDRECVEKPAQFVRTALKQGSQTAA